jgi:carboxypeptidase C (cathepsin A)
MVYVEQPHGVGFSTGPEPQTEADVARDFYNFLLNFYDVFDDLSPKRLFLFGESYAGYFVPSMAHKIYQENEKSSNSNAKHVNLAGIALGNGWVDAEVQGPALVQYAWWHGLIDTTTRRALEAQWKACRAGQSAGNLPPPLHPFTTPDDCGMVGAVVYAAGGGILTDKYNYGQFDFPGVNIYDVTTWDGYAVLFDDNSTYSQFFNNPAVREKLHAPDMDWTQCIPGAGRRRRRLTMLDNDQPESVMPYIAELLDEAGIRVLIYNGDRDMSTCSQGNEMLLDQMQWSGQQDWLDPTKTRRGLWIYDRYPAGYSRPLGNLEFVVVYNSGHLVPYNQPGVALDLIQRFVNGRSFADHPLPIIPFPEGHTRNFLGGLKYFFHYHRLLSLLVGVLIGVLVTLGCQALSRKRNSGYEPIQTM